MKKSFTNLSVADVGRHPIWRFTNNSQDELEIEVVDQSKRTDLDGLIVATTVVFKDQSEHLALIQNVSLASPSLNDHFLTLTIERGGRWFPLARYHDVDFRERGPKTLASSFGKSNRDVFPIAYDLRSVLGIESDALVGIVRDEPVVRLTQE